MRAECLMFLWASCQFFHFNILCIWTEISALPVAYRPYTLRLHSLLCEQRLHLWLADEDVFLLSALTSSPLLRMCCSIRSILLCNPCSHLEIPITLGIQSRWYKINIWFHLWLLWRCGFLPQSHFLTLLWVSLLFFFLLQAFFLCHSLCLECCF